MQHLTFLPLEKKVSVVKVSRTNCSAVTPKVIFEGSYIEENKEGKEMDEEEEKKNLLKNRSTKAQQLQGMQHLFTFFFF